MDAEFCSWMAKEMNDTFWNSRKLGHTMKRFQKSLIKEYTLNPIGGLK